MMFVFSEDNFGTLAQKSNIQKIYEDIRIDTELPLGEEYTTRSMTEGEEEDVTYGKKRFEFFVEEALPSGIRERYPKFTFFIKSFYDWLHEENNISSLMSLRDIDLAEEKFLKYYKEMLARNYPESLKLNWSNPSESIINIRMLLKHVRKLYQSKSTEDAINFFFRSLFAPIGSNQNKVILSLPKTRILRFSDGVWNVGDDN
jgi:hypothetical protein